MVPLGSRKNREGALDLLKHVIFHLISLKVTADAFIIQYMVSLQFFVKPY